MSAHTPGPWTVTRAPGAYLWIEATPGIVVAETRAYPYTMNNSVNAEANANLIAAAPALADALEKLRGNYLACIEQTLLSVPVPSGNPALSRVFADIHSLVKHGTVEIDAALRAAGRLP